MTDEWASVVEVVALLDQFVALGLTRLFGVIVVDKIKQELNVTLQHVQVDWNRNRNGFVCMRVCLLWSRFKTLNTFYQRLVHTQLTSFSHEAAVKNTWARISACSITSWRRKFSALGRSRISDPQITLQKPVCSTCEQTNWLRVPECGFRRFTRYNSLYPVMKMWQTRRCIAK